MKNIIWFSLFFIANIFGATHVVLNTNDSGIGSLRQAIIDANIDPNPEKIIAFSIESGVQIIKPLTALPPLVSSNIVIDGSTQPGWSDNNPMIIIDGSLLPKFRFNAFTIDTANNCIIQDLVINNGFFSGVTIIGESSHNAIYRCFIGTNQLGTEASPNALGIQCNAHVGDQADNIIGAQDKGNLISGNTYVGIILSGNLESILIQSNKIGVTKSGLVGLPNGLFAIAIYSAPISTRVLCNDTKIGGLLAGEGNIIHSIVSGTEMFFSSQPITNTIIEGNVIIA